MNITKLKKRDLWRLIIISFSGAVLFWIRIGLIYSGYVDGDAIHSVDVDSKDNLYIGYVNSIDVYNYQGEKIRSIVPPTSRAFVFYIEKAPVS